MKLYDILQDFAAQAKLYIQNALPKKVSDLPNDAGYITKDSNITGRSDSATKDSAGNVIVDTYATKTEVSNTYATIEYVENHSSGDLQVTEGTEQPKIPKDRGVWIQLGDDIAEEGATYDNADNKYY